MDILPTDVSGNSDDKKVRYKIDCYILHTVLLMIILLLDVNNIIISNLTETNNTSKYLIGYLDEVVKRLVLILPKMS